MWLSRLIKNNDGQALVYVALGIVVLLGITGLVIDGGRLYLAKSQLQKAVDAGALAGAHEMVKTYNATTGFDFIAAEDEVEDMAAENYSNDGITYDTNFPTGSTVIIEVTGQESVPLFLMPILGFDNTDITAVAQAKVGEIISVGPGDIIPVGINFNFPFEEGVHEISEITSNPGAGNYGNFGFLNFSSLDSRPPSETNNGADALAYYINNGSPAPISQDEEIWTKTGVPFNKNVIDAIEAKEGKYVSVPIISDFSSGTSQPVTVQGFAVFKLIDFYKVQGVHTIRAEFVYRVENGEIGNGTSGYGLFGVKLIK